MLSKSIESKMLYHIVENKYLTNEQLAVAKTKATAKSMSLIAFLVEEKIISNDDSIKIMAAATNTPFIDLSTIKIPDNIVSIIPKTLAKEYMAVSFEKKGNQLFVAMLDPNNIQAVDFLTKKIGSNIKTFMATKSSIDSVISRIPDNLDKEVQSAITKVKTLDEVTGSDSNDTGATKIVQDAPITRALNSILESAINKKASDIHIEPRETGLKIRFRVDGMLQEVMSLPKSIEPALVSRIKIMSNLKIDEHRVPQDGQAEIAVLDREVDLRVAISPVTYGEQVVIRILDKGSMNIVISDLGFIGRNLKVITSGISKPHGMVLSTGPTGSGKSTTLYALIKEIKDVTINIVTLEDPVERKMDGVNQIQVNNVVGLTFSSGLRSILRQDPDVIMVGEIRDGETADLAVQAALTGHLVFSTLHTNSASGVLPRFADMDIEPYLIASTINTVIGQRLVRKICDNCKQDVKSNPSATHLINKTLARLLPKTAEDQKKVIEYTGYKGIPIYSEEGYTLKKGIGCDNCVAGYSGRIAIAEVFEMNDKIEDLLVNKATSSEIQAQAVIDGMITMQEDGFLKALEGITSIDEVERVATND